MSTPRSASITTDAPVTSSRRGAVRPCLKWAGGKRQLLRELRRFVPHGFDRYVEPFVGSGALFFDLCSRGQLESRTVLLADTNPDLIGTYAAIAADVETVIEALRTLAEGHAAHGAEHYYDVRDRLFNPERRRVQAQSGNTTGVYPARLAAMFIYLNRTGFNGLYRLNAHGGFNVPAGRYQKPVICDSANLRAVASALGRTGIQVRCAPFDEVLADCKAGDFVYLDPPYAPVSATANFTSYSPRGFSEADQRRLQQSVIALSQRGCSVLLSNSTAAAITGLYETDPAARRAGLTARRVPARRAINSDASRRGVVDEYLITNVVA